MTTFKIGILCTSMAMGASFTKAYLTNDTRTWGTVGIALAIASVAMPSHRSWKNPEQLLSRLTFILTACVMGIGIVMGIHELPNPNNIPMITWFALAAATCAAFVTVQD